jgi:hypothetical protein
MSMQRSPHVDATPLGPKYVDAILTPDMFCIPFLETFLFRIDTVTFPRLNLPLALHFKGLAEFLSRAALYQYLGCDLPKAVKDSLLHSGATQYVTTNLESRSEERNPILRFILIGKPSSRS